MKKRTLLFQLGFIITLFITVIEIILFIGSYNAQKKSLLQLRAEIIREDNSLKHSEEYIDMYGKTHHHQILSDSDIQMRLDEYSKNIFLLVILIIFFVVSGTLIIYQFIGGRHIKKLTELITLSRRSKEFHYYPESEIPNNDIGDVINNRNMMLHEIEAYQNNLEHKLEEMKKELVHSAKLSTIGELSSTIAHDLKNPLAVIVGSASILKIRVEKGHEIEQEKILDMAEKTLFAAERLNKLVNRMNQFNRKEDAKEELNFLSIIQNAQILIESKIKRSEVKITENLKDINRKLVGDSGAFEQVFMNLIGNAIDAMDEKNGENKEIKIKAKEENDKLTISIKDSGEGIPEELHEQVFASFFTTKEKGKGTGLGLRICRQIIEDHNGTLTLSPYKTGEGAEFIITL